MGMKQILQNLYNSNTIFGEILCPRTKRDQLLIRTSNTLISADTEKMLLDFDKDNSALRDYCNYCEKLVVIYIRLIISPIMAILIRILTTKLLIKI